MVAVLVLVVVAALAWVVFALPVRRRQRAHGAMQEAIVEGDEIITAGGIHALVREADEWELRVEIAPGVLVTLDRRAVAAVAQEPPADGGEPADAELASAGEQVGEEAGEEPDRS